MGKISIALKEEQEDAAASGFTEQDLSKLIKEIRQQQKNENCLVQRDSVTLHRLKQYETKQQESSTKKG